MANFLINNNFYIPTANPATPVVSEDLYEPRAVFSINASNQLQGTFWIVKNGLLLDQNLGSASFTIYDKDGNSIGITESGIVANSNGFYLITPVLANLIQDLTHYVVEIEISADNLLRKGVVGITLGE